MVKGREVKVNIFDMAGHPVFYEVDYFMFHFALSTEIYLDLNVFKL